MGSDPVMKQVFLRYQFLNVEDPTEVTLTARHIPDIYGKALDTIGAFDRMDAIYVSATTSLEGVMEELDALIKKRISRERNVCDLTRGFEETRSWPGRCKHRFSTYQQKDNEDIHALFFRLYLDFIKKYSLDQVGTE